MLNSTTVSCTPPSNTQGIIADIVLTQNGNGPTLTNAYTWIGKVHLKRKEVEKARGLFIGFVEMFPEFPGDGVRNIDLAVGTLIDEGQKDEAAALLNKWRQYFESLLGKDKRLNKKIEKALERMKSPERLKE